MFTDPIADMLTRIRNASQAKHDKVDIQIVSKMKTEIARILKEQGYIEDYKVIRGDNGRKVIRINLKYKGDQSVIFGLKRISRPGLRKYVGHQEIPKVLNGLGIAILSTSHGVMTDGTARREKLGGELLCYIW